MFYLLIWGMVITLIILVGLQGIRSLLKKKETLLGNHYFIIVKNVQGTIEWMIRSIHLWSLIEGKQKKITVLDLGSQDDTLAILNRLTYPKKKVDRLYLFGSQPFAQALGEMIEHSIKQGEKPIVFYFNKDSQQTITTQDHLPN